MRRLLENTSNESFLKASFAEHAQIENLLRNPEEVGAMVSRTRRTIPQSAPRAAELTPFRNEPVTDFAVAENRQAMTRAIEEVRQKLGQTYPLLIAGQEIRGNLRLLDSPDPSRSSRVVSRTAAATAEHAQKAIAAARSALPAWAGKPARDRAGVLIKAAGIMRQRRFELAAWEIFECGKPWREADADVAEAIDFCEFYAREMIRLAEPRRRDVPGETNACEHIPRGVAVVIPPVELPPGHSLRHDRRGRSSPATRWCSSRPSSRP